MKKIKVGKLVQVELYTRWCWGPYWRKVNYLNIGFVSIKLFRKLSK